MTDQSQAQMAQTFFALNALDNAPECYNFDITQRNKAPRSQKHVDHRWQPYPIRGTQDFRQHEPKPHAQLLPQPHSTRYPPDLYINQNFALPGPAPKADYEMTSTFGAGGILGPQSMQMAIGPASVAPLTNTQHYDNMIPRSVQAAFDFDTPVMQTQLPALPEGATHWPASHSLKDHQVPTMLQYPPAPSTVQYQMQATSYDQGYDQGLVHQAPSERTAEGCSVQRTERKAVDSERAVQMKQPKNTRIRPDEDPEFQQVLKDGKILYRCLKERCVEIYLKESSVHRHKQTNKHQMGSNRLPCLACGHYFSRGDGLKRHANSGQCSRNQKKSHGVAAANLAPCVVPPPANVPQEPSTFQGTGPAAEQAPPSFVLESNSSSGPAVQPVIQAPWLNSMTHEVTPCAENLLSLPDVQFSAQAPYEQRSTPHQPSVLPFLPVIDQEAQSDIDLFGSPVSPTLPDHGYPALDSLVPAPSTSEFEAEESYWDWYNRLLEQPIQDDLNSIY